MSPDPARRVVASDWYAANVGEPWVGVSTAAGSGPLARTRVGRGLLIHRAARRGAGAALIRNERGALTALWLAALTRRGPVVLLETIPNRPPRATWKRVLAAIWFRLVERPAVRHGMRAGQAMSAAETRSLATIYGLAADRFPHVGWALCRTGEADAPAATARAGVLASGRAACDWETLFAAASPEWALTVVCGAGDRARVEALDAAAHTGARILSEIGRDEHDELMRAAAVYAMPLTEDRLSSGQVRLQTATELGAPVLVTRISTLAEYFVDGETAVGVELGDPAGLRAAVDSLLADPGRRDALARAALARARSRTYPEYFRAVRGMVENALTAAVAAALVSVLALAVAAPAARSEVAWLCHPDLVENPCEIPLDTTVREPDGSERVVTPPRRPQGERRIDCFYVYPTVSNQPRPLATKSRDPELVSIAKYQAAPFSARCRIFAPIYRQRTVPALLTGSLLAADREVSYRDVEEAFRAYRSEHPGRGVVLIGHSQGTRMLRLLISRLIEPRSGVRDDLVGAILLGGNVTVESGRVRGGDFNRIPLCSRRGQFGCAVAYSTFGEDPPPNSSFGRVAEGADGLEVACTDPGPLSGIRSPVPVTVPNEPFALGFIALSIAQAQGGLGPSASTTFQTTPDRYAGGCARLDGAHVYRFDPLPGSRRPRPSPSATWGTHIIDMNLGIERLVEVVRRQERSWVRSRR